MPPPVMVNRMVENDFQTETRYEPGYCETRYLLLPDTLCHMVFIEETNPFPVREV